MILDKDLKQRHKVFVDMQDRCRRIEKGIKLTKVGKDSASDLEKGEERNELEYWKQKTLDVENRQMDDYENKIKTLKMLQLRDKELENELKVVSIVFKEKEQEQKLQELKMREQRRQMPKGKLKPINETR